MHTTTLTKSDMRDMLGCDVYGPDGDKIGSLDNVYVDRATDEVEWAAVNTGLFGMRSSFVPLAGATRDGDDLRVEYTKDTVKDAPSVDADGGLSEEEEARLYAHYGRDYTPYDGEGVDHAAATTASPAATTTHDTDARADLDREAAVDTDAARTGGDELTLSEEQVEVRTTERQAGRLRLRKYVVTDEEQVTVPVRKEVARVERETITDGEAATHDVDLGEGETEVVLTEEEVEVTKRAVPKERIRVDKDVVTEERTVSETVAREEVEVEGDAEVLDRR